MLEPSGPAVLVVDDVPAVRRVLAAVVASHGFTPFPAGSGTEAVAVLRESGTSAVAVVLDVQMPEMDGPATLMALREIAPGLPCVFVSGHTGKYSEAELLALGAAAVLDKPNVFAALGPVLRAAMRRPQHPTSV